MIVSLTLDNLSSAKTLIEKANTAQLKEIISRAEALRIYAQQAKKGLEIQNQVAEIKLRAERRIGDQLKEMPKNKGAQGVGAVTRLDRTPTLKELGIEKNESSRWQAVAGLPEKEFEKHILAVKASNSELTTVGVIKLARQVASEKKRSEDAEQGSKLITSDVDFRLGDFMDVLADIKDNSIDTIITDPPYPAEFLNEWSKLSEFANRVLKSSGFCITYSGQMNLPEVIKQMSSHLTYYWTFCVYHEGKTQIVNGVNLICRWKPVLVFQKAPRHKIMKTIQDYFISEQREKTQHDWQQSESGVKYLFENFTSFGDTVIDPFAGSGTFLKVGRELKRKMIGAESDERTFNIAKVSLNL